MDSRHHPPTSHAFIRRDGKALTPCISHHKPTHDDRRCAKGRQARTRNARERGALAAAGV